MADGGHARPQSHGRHGHSTHCSDSDNQWCQEWHGRLAVSPGACIDAREQTNRSTAVMNIQMTIVAWSWVHLAMGYNFDFFNFIIMMSSCHMSTQIQIPNPKADIISYQPISCLEK